MSNPNPAGSVKPSSGGAALGCLVETRWSLRTNAGAGAWGGCDPLIASADSFRVSCRGHCV